MGFKLSAKPIIVVHDWSYNGHRFYMIGLFADIYLC